MPRSSSQEAVKLIFFGILGELTGCRDAMVPISGPTPLVEVLAGYLTPMQATELSVRAWVNGEPKSIEFDSLVRPGDEIALLPPSSGG